MWDEQVFRHRWKRMHSGHLLAVHICTNGSAIACFVQSKIEAYIVREYKKGTWPAGVVGSGKRHKTADEAMADYMSRVAGEAGGRR